MTGTSSTVSTTDTKVVAIAVSPKSAGVSILARTRSVTKSTRRPASRAETVQLAPRRVLVVNINVAPGLASTAGSFSAVVGIRIIANGFEVSAGRLIHDGKSP